MSDHEKPLPVEQIPRAVSLKARETMLREIALAERCGEEAFQIEEDATEET